MTTSVQRALSHPLMLPLYVPSLIYAFARSMLIPVLPVYGGTFTDDLFLLGLLLAGLSLGQMAGDLPSGWLQRRFGRKRLMVVGIGIEAVMITLLAAAGSIWAALALTIAGGFGTSLYNLTRHDYLSEIVKVGKRGRAISIFGGVFRLGKFTGPAIGALLAGRIALELPFMVVGVLHVVAIVFVVRFMAADDPARRGAATVGRHPNVLRVIWEHRSTLGIAGLGQIGVFIVRSGTVAILPLYGEKVLGLDVVTVGLIVSIGAFMDLLLFYPAGMIMDRFGRKWAVVPSFLTQALGMALIPLATGAGGLIVAAALIGFGNGISSGTMMTIGADLAPKDARGEYLGAWRLIGDVGIVSGPLIVGGVGGLLSLGASALVVATMGVAAAGVFAFGVPETLRRETAAQVKEHPAGS